MKKVYTIFNADISNIVLSTTDRSFAEESMMDAFMEDVLYEWYWRAQYENVNLENAPRIAKEVWNDLIYWYTEYVEIFESEVVEA